jgi:hypothetical protein
MEHFKLTDVELLCLLFEEFSKKSVFKLAEYADVAKFTTKLTKIKDGNDESATSSIELPEMIYLIQVLQAASTRYATPIQNWEPILNVYKKTIQIAQAMEKAQKETEAQQSEKTSIEELGGNMDIKSIPE